MPIAADGETRRYSPAVDDRLRNDAPPMSARPWWYPPAVGTAAVLWVFIAYLGFIEVNDLVRGSETEHSPVPVIAVLLLPAGLLTWAALAARR